KRSRGFYPSSDSPTHFCPTILWTQPKPADLDWPTLQPLPWQSTQVERLATDIRPGQHPLHNQGYFYCLDFSSVMAAVLIQAIACQFILKVPLIGLGN
ncbi:MAG: hypothetical protein ACFB0E_07760, partial [Leptolyngbyaceae cyanobacterium]